MGRFEIGQIDKVPFASDGPLHCDEVGERTDRGLHTVNATSLGALQKVREAQCSGSLREEVKLTVRSGQVDRPISGDPTFGDR